MFKGGHFPDSPNVPTVPFRKAGAVALVVVSIAAATPIATAASPQVRPGGGHCC